MLVYLCECVMYVCVCCLSSTSEEYERLRVFGVENNTKMKMTLTLISQIFNLAQQTYNEASFTFNANCQKVAKTRHQMSAAATVERCRLKLRLFVCASVGIVLLRNTSSKLHIIVEFSGIRYNLTFLHCLLSSRYS